MCAMLLKHVIIIEDCDVIFIATFKRRVRLKKKWDVNDFKIKKLAKRLLKLRNFLELFLIDI